MPREKPPEEPKDDIPAWFMTYSDVITLLMTFFILLLTFATTEPERFEKSISTLFSNGSATGTAGKKMKSIDPDSMVNRLRVPASRIALRGAEMPPITREPPHSTWGKGLKSLNSEEAKQNELTSHEFSIPFTLMFDSGGSLTARGKQICQLLSNQLHDLPFRAAVKFSDVNRIENVAGMMDYLFHTEMTRPGQVAMSLTNESNVPTGEIRFSIERFSQNEHDSYVSGLEQN